MNKENETVLVEGFRQRMSDHGLNPREIISDGNIHRFPTWGDKKDESSGAYWYNGNVGWFQDWRTMDKPEIVHGELSDADREALNGSFTSANDKVSREALEKGIRRIWNSATGPDGHPYLLKKGIAAPPEVRQFDGCLILPVFGLNGELNGLQKIDPDGRKRFLAGTEKKGSFYSITGTGVFVICEGFSTGVSLHAATGANIVIAFDAGNLANVAKEISKKVSPKNIIIAGDNDLASEKNIGAELAEKAAKQIGCRFVLPVFQNPDGKQTTDFNDLHRAEGLGAVKIQFENALAQTESKSDLINEVLSIIDLDPLTREQERNRISDEHNVRKSVIDQFIKELRKKENVCGTTSIVTEVSPAEVPVDGAELLSTIKKELLKYVILPAGVAEPIAAWIVLTYCYDVFRILPMLGIISPVKRCGKTTLLEILQGLVSKGLAASNVSSAAVFRTIEKYSPTLLVDEADSFLKDNDELRGVLNSGHTRTTAFVIRVEGDDHEPRKFSTWGPKAVAMIGNLPDTLHDRSIVVSLRRKAPGETVSRIDVDFENECLELRQACRRWADDNMDRLRIIKPDIPITNNDRTTDNWMPLLAIADIAGGPWPELMRKSLFGMFDSTDESIGPKLLKDIRDILNAHPGEKIFSDELVESLNAKKESPWCDWNRGKGLTQHGFARLLKSFGIYSKTIRISEDRRKGYELSRFDDAFERYIPLIPPISTVTTGQTNNIEDLDENQSVTNINDVTDEKQLNLLESFNCHNVTDKNRGVERNEDMPLWKRLRFENEQAYLEMISK